ncbi:MAG: hypothetical protein HDR02_01005 [Lachnospiraceae bacterium]|nr:hypothetical protein [Lachnospiraceae bacterium]
MKIYVGSIFITIMILILAAILIFWKPGKKSRYRFIRLAAGNLMIHLADGFITYVNTPGLEREGNPLVSKLGFGWGALFLANLIVFGLVILCTWCFCRYEHIHLEATGVFDYFMKLMYGEGYKPGWFWYKMPKNRHPMFALYGYVLYWGVTAGAPIPVFGWILDMLDIHPPIRNSIWLSIGIGISVGMLCMYKWAADGYRCGRHE